MKMKYNKNAPRSLLVTYQKVINHPLLKCTLNVRVLASNIF